MKTKPNRRTFLKGLGATWLMAQMPVWQSCNEVSPAPVLNEQQLLILKQSLHILFPPYKQTPLIEDLNTVQHILFYLSDPNIDPDEQKFVIDGINWLNETAQENQQKNFTALDKNSQQKIISQIKQENWGEAWLSKLLTLTFESLLLDPLYHVNIDETGWKWLHHHPGLPRPKHHNKYPLILNRKKENIIITQLDQL